MTRRGLLAALLLMTALLGIAGYAILQGRSVAPASAPQPASELVIPPGREERVMAWLAPFYRDGFAGQTLGDVSIVGGDLRIDLQGARPEVCPNAPSWMHGPGALEIAYQPRKPGVAWTNDGLTERRSGSAEAAGIRLSWASCSAVTSAWDDAARLWSERLGAAYAGDIWGSPGTKAGGTTPREERPGLVSPVAEWIGRPVGTCIVAAWVIAWFVTALVCAGLPDPDKPARRRPRWAWLWAAIWLIVGVHLRHGGAWAAPFDSDEPWALPTSHGIVVDDHDAWVHPPLHRALQKTWGRVIYQHYAQASAGAEAGAVTSTALAWVRAPSVMAGILSLLLVALAWLRAPRLWSAPALVLLAVSPVLIADVSLARPYAFASLWVVVVGAALWRERPGRLAWWAALLAAGLAAWTDVLCGAIAGCLIAFAAATTTRISWGRRAALCVAFALWMAPLLPGVWVAAHREITPDPAARAHAGAVGAPDLRPELGIGGGDPPRFFAAMIENTVCGGASGALAVSLGVLGLAALGAAAYRARRSSHVAALFAAAGLLVVASTVGGLRSRHLLGWSHLVPLAWVLIPRERNHG